MEILFTAIFGFIGAFISRWHGGAFFPAPKAIKNTIWAAPLGALSFMVLLSGETPVHLAILGAIGATLFCMVGKATGHGRVWNPLSPLNLGVKPERLEWPIKWLIGSIPDTAYKMIAMALIGFAAVSGAAFAIGYIDPLAGCVAALGGILGKSIGYFLGFKFKEEFYGFPEELDEPTEFGEIYTGFFSFAFVFVATIMVVA